MKRRMEQRRLFLRIEQGRAVHKQENKGRISDLIVRGRLGLSSRAKVLAETELRVSKLKQRSSYFGPSFFRARDGF